MFDLVRHERIPHRPCKRRRQPHSLDLLSLVDSHERDVLAGRRRVGLLGNLHWREYFSERSFWNVDPGELTIGHCRCLLCNPALLSGYD